MCPELGRRGHARGAAGGGRALRAALQPASRGVSLRSSPPAPLLRGRPRGA